MSFTFNEVTKNYHIAIVASVPNYKIKNQLNFRVYSVELADGRVIRDPEFPNSRHVFPIKNALVGKKIQFDFSFEKSDIINVKKFRIGFCDEMVRWLDSTILTFGNTLFEHESPTSGGSEVSAEGCVELPSNPKVEEPVIESEVRLDFTPTSDFSLAKVEPDVEVLLEEEPETIISEVQEKPQSPTLNSSLKDSTQTTGKKRGRSKKK